MLVVSGCHPMGHLHDCCVVCKAIFSISVLPSRCDQEGMNITDISGDGVNTKVHCGELVGWDDEILCDDENCREQEVEELKRRVSDVEDKLEVILKRLQDKRQAEHPEDSQREKELRTCPREVEDLRKILVARGKEKSPTRHKVDILVRQRVEDQARVKDLQEKERSLKTQTQTVGGQLFVKLKTIEAIEAEIKKVKVELDTLNQKLNAHSQEMDHHHHSLSTQSRGIRDMRMELRAVKNPFKDRLSTMWFCGSEQRQEGVGIQGVH